MTPTTDKRVWADVNALAADLKKLRFDAQVQGKKVKFSLHYIYGHVPYKRHYGPGDLSGVPGATVSGVGEVVDGAVKLTWSVRLESGETIAIEPVMATNRGSLLKQLVDHFNKIGRGTDGLASRFRELMNDSDLAMELKGFQAGDQYRKPPLRGDQAAAARKGTLNLGQSLNTRQLENTKPGHWLELVHEGKLIATLLVVENGKTHLMGADNKGVYSIPLKDLKVEDTSAGFRSRRHWDLAEAVDLKKYRLKLDEGSMADVRQALKEAK